MNSLIFLSKSPIHVINIIEPNIFDSFHIVSYSHLLSDTVRPFIFSPNHIFHCLSSGWMLIIGMKADSRVVSNWIWRISLLISTKVFYPSWVDDLELHSNWFPMFLILYFSRFLRVKHSKSKLTFDWNFLTESIMKSKVVFSLDLIQEDSFLTFEE